MEQIRATQTPSHDDELGRAWEALPGHSHSALPATGPLPGYSSPRVSDLIALLGSVPLAGSSGELIDQLRGLEELKSAITGLQARAAVAFDRAQRAEQARAGVPASE